MVVLLQSASVRRTPAGGAPARAVLVQPRRVSSRAGGGRPAPPRGRLPIRPEAMRERGQGLRPTRPGQDSGRARRPLRVQDHQMPVDQLPGADRLQNDGEAPQGAPLRAQVATLRALHRARAHRRRSRLPPQSRGQRVLRLGSVKIIRCSAQDIRRRHSGQDYEWAAESEQTLLCYVNLEHQDSSHKSNSLPTW